MFVACSTSCFGRLPLNQVLALMKELEFGKVDVAIHEEGPHLRPSEVVADVGSALQRIRGGPSLVPAAFSVRIAADDDKDYVRQLKAVCRLARLATVSVLTIPAATSQTPFEAEVRRLTGLVHLAEVEGLILTVATHIGTLAETPEAAVQLCEKVPGLGLTLDPSHYITGPNQGKPYDAVFPFVRHVHLRDTGKGPNQFQVRIGQGEIEYGRLVGQLTRHHYDRLLTVAIHDVADAPFAMEPEVRKLKFLLESLV